MMQTARLKIAFIGLFLMAAAGGQCGVNGAPVRDFVAALSGDAERPTPVVTTGAGSGTFTLNEAETQLTYSVTADDLSGPVTMAHFHLSNNGAEGSGGIVEDISANVTETGGQVSIGGVWSVSATDVANIRAGDIYVNLHTSMHSSGEIRGNLIPAP